MDPQRSYDPFGPGMSAGVFSPAPMPKKTGKKRRKKHPVRRFFRTGLLILLACLVLQLWITATPDDQNPGLRASVEQSAVYQTVESIIPLTDGE